MRLIILFICALLLTVSVNAIGVGPVETYKVFEPGREYRVRLVIFNEGEPFDIYSRGELGEYIEFEDFHANDSTTTIYYSFQAESLGPGAHYAEIIVKEASEDNATVVAEASSVSKLRVQVPYDYKYAQAKMDIKTIGRKAVFLISVYNFYRDPVQFYADVNIDDEFDLSSEKIVLDSMAEDTLRVEQPLAIGPHHAKATVHYDEKDIVLEKDFLIGKPEITVSNITAPPVKRGDIAEMIIRLESDWPETLEAYGMVTILKNSTIVEKIRTETVNIEDEAELAAYWETGDNPQGAYLANLDIIYDEHTTSEQFQIRIIEKEEKAPTGTIVLLIILLVAVAALSAWYINRNREKKKQI